MSRYSSLFTTVSLREGRESLEQNVKHSIQYDHLSEFERIHFNSREFCALVNKAVENGYSIEYVIEEYREAVADLLKMTFGDITENKLTSASVTLNGHRYHLSNASRLQDALSQAQTFLAEVGPLVASRKSRAVPKNSDKATEEVREFVMKPALNEMLIASMLHRRSRTIVQWLNENVHKKVHVYGPRTTSKGDFIPYIHEYNLMEQHCKKLRKESTHLVATDLVKYFSNIKVEELVKIFSKLFGSSKEAIFLGNLLKFTYIDKKGYQTRAENGLTIESNYQHYLANILMGQMLTEFINTSKEKMGRHPEYEIVSYIDDIYIFCKGKETQAHDLLDDFKMFMKATYGFELSDAKTSVKSTMQDLALKGLVRLPTINYFDILPEVNKDFTEELSEELLHSYQQIISRLNRNNFNDAIASMTDAQVNLVYSLVLYSYRDKLEYFEANGRNVILTPVQSILEKPVMIAIAKMATHYGDSITEMMDVGHIKNENGHNFIGVKSAAYFYNLSKTYEETIRDNAYMIKRDMDANDIEFYIMRYKQFEFSFDWFRPGLQRPILSTLQYLYLVRTKNSEEAHMVVDSALRLLSDNPNKSRFIAGIIKRQYRRGQLPMFNFEVKLPPVLPGEKYELFNYSMSRL